MGLRLVTPPLAEPVTLAEAKDHLRVEHAADDARISKLITAARGWVEANQDRALVTQTWDLSLDLWPDYFRGHEIRVPLSPLVSVSSITYVGTDGNLAALAADQYQVSPGSPGRIRPAYGRCWPAARRVLDGITVRFVAGYGGASAVPETTKQAVHLLIGHWYANREGVVIGTISKELELTVASLLACEAPGTYS